MANLGSSDTPIKGQEFELPAGAKLAEVDGDLAIVDSNGNPLLRRDDAAGEWNLEGTDLANIGSVHTEVLASTRYANLFDSIQDAIDDLPSLSDNLVGNGGVAGEVKIPALVNGYQETFGITGDLEQANAQVKGDGLGTIVEGSGDHTAHVAARHTQLKDLQLSQLDETGDFDALHAEGRISAHDFRAENLVIDGAARYGMLVESSRFNINEVYVRSAEVAGIALREAQFGEANVVLRPHHSPHDTLYETGIVVLHSTEAPPVKHNHIVGRLACSTEHTTFTALETESGDVLAHNNEFDLSVQDSTDTGVVTCVDWNGGMSNHFDVTAFDCATGIIMRASKNTFDLVMRSEHSDPVGVDLQSPDNQGTAHIIALNGSEATGVNVAHDGNDVRAWLDVRSGGTALDVSGHDNNIQATVSNGSVSITGNYNEVSGFFGDTVSVGNSANILTGRFMGDVTVTTGQNVLIGQFDGDITLESGASKCVLMGQARGTVTDNGTDNETTELYET